MFNFLKKPVQYVKEVLVEPEVTNKELIEQIHAEFNISGDKALLEAQNILSGIDESSIDKSNRLKSLGFTSTRQVVQNEQQLKLKVINENMAKALTELSEKYPQYKFITKDMALKICEKYNLVLGNISQYMGFVPEKNLLQIEKFFEVENNLNTRYYGAHTQELYNSYIFRRREEVFEIDKSTYEKKQANKLASSALVEEREKVKAVYEEYKLWKKRPTLSIAAPLKEMKMEDHELKGREVIKKHIPDPVVLCGVNLHGTNVYAIITAWGEEASDEMVVNQKMN